MGAHLLVQIEIQTEYEGIEIVGFIRRNSIILCVKKNVELK